jgi:hypothetical protein
MLRAVSIGLEQPDADTLKMLRPRESQQFFKLRLGFAGTQVPLVQAFLNAALAAGQLLAYSGVHSKSLPFSGDEHSTHTHQTPEIPRDFEFFHNLFAAPGADFA